eukprot:CAMPEP_0170218024 /NCGR_PEP_ID=MMETSP0116_2-20130129/8681_1 /TAXON_ID=400756 /ORGANISM="Durinskia baltica, Strain CSIRO CS-38" /LENGTH=422 /DNA_ID=CAMNT_0010468665 /DNA_START=60 /DNA_END=1324 /DNA_ORIENTATION=-
MGPAALPLSAAHSEDCCDCGCPAQRHQDATNWLADVRSSLRRFRHVHTTNRRLPPTAELPVEALDWTSDEAALHVLSGGRFKPRRLHRDPAPEVPLVSICVPTSTRRHEFHRLLHKNFDRQTYKNLELVVVDTGPKPSDLLEQESKRDQRIVYCHWPVQDARLDRLRGALARQRLSPQPSSYTPSTDSWSLGLKRNIAAALASGQVIVHFDDDDLYSTDYVDFMVGELRRLVQEQGGSLEKSAGLVKLAEWHLFDFAGMRFHFIDPKTDPLTLDDWRMAMLYGYGFSYVYTRRAWERQAFPDTEDQEDDIFIKNLRQQQQTHVRLVRRKHVQDANNFHEETRGLVAHSFHADNTGVSEFSEGGPAARAAVQRGLALGLRPLGGRRPPGRQAVAHAAEPPAARAGAPAMEAAPGRPAPRQGPG